MGDQAQQSRQHHVGNDPSSIIISGGDGREKNGVEDRRKQTPERAGSANPLRHGHRIWLKRSEELFDDYASTFKAPHIARNEGPHENEPDGFRSLGQPLFLVSSAS